MTQAVVMAHHRDTETTEDARQVQNGLTHAVIGAAIEVHRHLGPGLLESVYQHALELELRLRGVQLDSQVLLPVRYKGQGVGTNLRLDFVIERQVIVEVKAVERILNIHRAQLLTYLKLTRLRIGLIINFNVAVLSNGVRRIVNG